MNSCECFQNHLNLRSQRKKKEKKKEREKKKEKKRKVSLLKIGFNNIEVLGNFIFCGITI